MSDDNILSFPGKPANDMPPVKTSQIKHDEVMEKAKEAQLKVLDDIRNLIETDKIDSFAIIALSPVGAILTEYCPPGAHRYDYPATFVGALRGLEHELVEAVRIMPQMLNDGTIVAHSDTVII